MKLEKGKKYSQLVEKSFHISHAALTSCKVKTECVFEVHVVVENTDYVLCYLGHLNNQLLVQQPLDLNISEGEEIVFYVAKSNGRPGDDEIGVYLTGYFREDPEVPFNLDDLLDAEDEDVDDDEVAEEDGEVGNEGEEDLWTALMMNESLSETDSDEDYTINDDLLKNEQGLLLPIKGKPIIEEVVSMYVEPLLSCVLMMLGFVTRQRTYLLRGVTLVKIHRSVDLKKESVIRLKIILMCQSCY